MTDELKRKLRSWGLVAALAAVSFAGGYTAGRAAAPDHREVVEDTASREEARRLAVENTTLRTSLVAMERQLEERTTELETLKKVKKTKKQTTTETRPDGTVIKTDTDEQEESEEVAHFREETKRLLELVTATQQENLTLRTTLDETSKALEAHRHETVTQDRTARAPRLLVGAGYGISFLEGKQSSVNLGPGWAVGHASVEVRLTDGQLRVPLLGPVLGPIYGGVTVTSSPAILGTVRVGLF